MALRPRHVLVAGLVFAAGVAAACGSGTRAPDASVPFDASLDVVDASLDGLVDAQSAAADVGTDALQCVPTYFPCGFDPCPDTLPEAGTPCDASVGCGYQEPTSGCFDRASCLGGAWTLELAAADASCLSVPPAGCPTTFAAALARVNEPCDTLLGCSYPQGTCGCPAIFPDAQSYVWACVYPPADSGCPAEVPGPDASCTAPMECPYGYLCPPLNGPVMLCDCCGRWTPAGALPCPPL